MDQFEFENLLSSLMEAGIVERQDEARDAISNISLFFENDLSSVEAQLYVGLSLDTKNGLFKFLLAVAQGPSNRVLTEKPPSTEVFQLLTDLILKYQHIAEQHADSMVRWCVNLLNIETQLRPQSIKLAETVLLNCTNVQVDNHVDSIVKFLRNERKITPTLRLALFSVLGVACASHPAAMASQSDWFIDTLLKALKDSQTSKSKSSSLIEGCFLGLDGYLQNFSIPSQHIGDFYQHLKDISCSIPLDAHSRRTMNRAALRVLTRHASSFLQLIYDDLTYWHLSLAQWLKAPNSDEKHLGIMAFATFYQQIATYIISDSPPPNARDVFDYLSKKLQEDLNRDFEQSPYSRKRAVVGLAELAPCFFKFETEASLRSILSSMLALSSTVNESMSSVLGVYLVSLSKIVACLKCTLAELLPLCRLTVLLIESFPNVSQTFREYSMTAVEKGFCSLYSCGLTDIDKHMHTVLYQGLLRSCAHRLYIDTQILEENGKCISYKSYVEVWTYLLTIKSRANIELPPDIAAIVGGLVFDTFISVFFEIISKLDLEVTVALHDLADPDLALEARTPNDFLIFVNLVDLFHDVIPASDTGLLEKWLPTIIRDNIGHCKEKPMVSGFHKIISTCLNIPCAQELLANDETLRDEFISFVKGLLKRMDAMKGDLKIACLIMILSCPAAVVESLLDHIPNILLTSITGKSMLLKQALLALERWRVQLPAEKLIPILKEVLPAFDSFLQTSVSTSHNLNVESKIKAKGKRTKRRQVFTNDRELLELQKQFLIFLGKLQPHVCAALVKLPEANSHIEGNKLMYKLHLPDCFPTIALNVLIERSMDLALSSGDRNTRVTACEFLHACLLIAISRTRGANSNHFLLKKMMSAAVILSCDGDAVISNLFRSLVLQSTHYFSGKLQLCSQETSDLVNVLVDAASHEHDLGIRDFSARCLKEFLHWSVKQMTPEELATAPHNIRAVLRTLCTNAVHPDRYKRFGSAVIFNHVYSIIREESSILDHYWFELYHAFVENLEMCSNDDDSRIIAQALEHVLRPLRERFSLFLQSNPQRRVPSAMNGGSLKDLLVYTFGKCKTMNKHLRKTSQSTVMKLLPKLGGSLTLKDFIRDNGLNIDVEQNIDFEAMIDYYIWLCNEEAISVHLLATNSKFVEKILLKYENTFPPRELITTLLEFCSKTYSLLNSKILQSLARLLFMMPSDDRIVQDGFLKFLSKVSTSTEQCDKIIYILPALNSDSLVQQLKNSNMNEQLKYIRGFLVVQRSNILRYNYTALDILDALLGNHFTKRGSRITCNFLDPIVVKNYRKMVAFILQQDIDVQKLVHVITDNTDVENDGKLSSKGKCICELYVEEITNRIIATPAQYTGFLENILRGVNEYDWILYFLTEIERSKDEKKKLEFAENCLNIWEILQKMVHVSEIKLFIFLKAVCNVAGKSFGYLTNRTLISTWLTAFIASKAKSMDYDYVSRLFDLIPQLSLYMEEENIDLQTALNRYRNSSKLFLPPNRLTFLGRSIIDSLCKSLFRSIELTGSLPVIHIVANMIVGPSDVLPLESIDECLLVFASKFPSHHVVKAADIMYQLLFTDSYNADLKAIARLRERLANFLVHSSKDVVLSFFVRHLNDVSNIITATKYKVSVEEEIVKKISAVRLIEILYLKTVQEEREKLCSEVAGKSGSEFFKQIFKSCTFSSIGRGRNQEVAEIIRLFNCACVNMKCAFVSQIPRFDEVAFVNFLFTETKSYKDSIWYNTIDDEKQYNLTMDFTDLPKRKSIITGIRGKSLSSTDSDKIVKYAHSQTLFESSLSEDVQKFDLTNVAVQKTDSTEGIMTVELELDAINQHEIMASICGVIQHMVLRKIQKPLDKELPCWLRWILDVLKSSEAHRNAKLFALRAIHNLEQFVEEFVQKCAADILFGLHSTFVELPTNYLLVDILAFVIRAKPVLSEGSYLTNILINMVRHPGTSQKNVIKFIFEVMKSGVELWGSILDKSALYKCILDCTSSNGELNVYIHLNFISILLANNIFLQSFDAMMPVLTWLLKIMQDDKKNCQLASEVLGMILNHSKDLTDFQTLCDYLIKKLTTMPGESEIDIIRLHHIHKFYPEISCQFVYKLLSSSWNGGAELKRRSLEMLLSHITRYDKIENTDLKACLKSFTKDLFKTKVSVVLDIALQIVAHIVRFIDDEIVVEIYESVIKLSEHPIKNIRLLAVNALGKIIQRYRAMSDYRQMVKSCEVATLKRLNDEDEGVQKAAEQFWCDSTLSNTSSRNRLIQILQDLYNPETESDFIEYSCRLILQFASLPLYYHQDIEAALTDCKYFEMQLHTSWRMQQSSMISPMFAPSISTEMNRLENDRPCATKSQIQIRATAQSLMFQPTQFEATASNVTTTTTQSEFDGEFKRPKLPIRFRRYAAQSSAMFAKLAGEKKDKEAKDLIDRQKQRESGIRLYRSYRQGDYPDVQIKHSHFIPTLLALATKDQQIARELFVTLITAISNEFSDADDFWTEASGIFDNMLKNSRHFDMLFVGSVFQVSLSNHLVLDTKKVCRTSKGTGLLALGALLIENAITYGDEQVRPAKRFRGEEDEETSGWLRLAQLYLEMGDIDGVRGVFLDKLEEPENARLGIQHEAVKDWASAAMCYQQVITSPDLSEERLNFYGQAYFNCTANLSDWTQLKNSISSSTDLNSLWENPNWSEFALPWYIRSTMASSLSGANNEFRDYITNCSANVDIAQTLNVRFSKEVALASCLGKKLPQATFHLNQSYLIFLSSWSQINAWDLRLKKTLINEAHVISEIKTAVEIASAQSFFEVANRELNDWKTITPNVQDNLVIWDIRLSIRKGLLEHTKSNESLDKNDLEELQKCLTWNQLHLAKVAGERGNLHLMKNYIMKTKSDQRSLAEDCLWEQCRNLFSFLKLEKENLSGVDKLKALSEALRKMDASYEKKMEADSIGFQNLTAHYNYMKLNILSSAIAECDSENIEISSLPIRSKYFNNLPLAFIECANNSLQAYSNDSEKIAEVHLKLAKFHRKNGSAHWKDYVSSLLTAMRYGSIEARQLFGSVLTMEGAFNCPEIETECNLVPSWMFLIWRQQLLSFLSQDDLNFVKIIINRLALDYPEALSYNLRIAMESYDESLKNSFFIRELKGRVLSNPLQEKFVKAMSLIACPYLKMKFNIEKIICETELSNALAKTEDLRKMISDSDNGEIYSLLKQFSPIIESILSLTTLIDVKTELKSLRLKLDQPIKLRRLIKSYNPWLAEYHRSGSGECLEVPGQYNGLAEPRVERHAKIGAFKADVTAMKSKTKPFKMTIVGNDARNYSFLVKYGEDLRQDERIQQVFRHIRTTLQNDKDSSDLHLDGYEVIPLTSNHGLIQWVENTKSLKELICMKVVDTDYQQAMNSHLNAICNVQKNVVQMYEHGYKHTPQDIVVASYEKQVGRFQGDIIRQQLWNICNTPEQFVCMRANFATSLGVLNIANWLIGVGDRHLDNLMVSTQTGRVLGIDFGLSFGLATSSLPLPELVPFRLTPQILGVLSPLNDSGWLKQTMLHTLRVLREDPIALLAILEVFVREPSVNWLEHANRVANDQGEIWDNNVNEWYPRQKIDAVAEKLKGANPVKCFEDDLVLGHSRNPCFADFLRVLKGNAGNLRSRCDESNLSVEQQISCLLDLAKDPVILAFTYVGWSPWF